MAVRIGKSYVSEAAYNFVTAEVKEDGKNTNELKRISQKFSTLKITVGAVPFSGTGTNNLSISPKVLRQMENDPEKRKEYEALIYDIANIDQTAGMPENIKVKASGFVIEDDGSLSGWTITSSDAKSQSSVKRTNEKNWWKKLLDNKSSKKKTSPLKDAQEKLLEKRKEIAQEKAEAEKEAVSVQISAAGKGALANAQKYQKG